MINFNRKDRAPDVGEVGKNTLRPAIYEPPGVTPAPTTTTRPARWSRGPRRRSGRGRGSVGA